MQLRIIQWNIRIGSNADAIGRLISESVQGPTIVHLQEVSENSFATLQETLQPGGAGFSLQYRRPGRYEGRNRQMGVATFTFGGTLAGQALVSRSVFPERTLVTSASFEEVSIKCLNFHSLTGVDYKKAKSSNFATLADFLADADLDFFACDANEPESDGLLGDQMKFFDNRDKGRCAAMIFGASPVHNLKDALKTRLRTQNKTVNTVPLAVSHITGGKARRYDHIYHSDLWSVKNVSYQYDAGISASSDHAIVIADFSRNTA